MRCPDQCSKCVLILTSLQLVFIQRFLPQHTILKPLQHGTPQCTTGGGNVSYTKSAQNDCLGWATVCCVVLHCLWVSSGHQTKTLPKQYNTTRPKTCDGVTNIPSCGQWTLGSWSHLCWGRRLDEFRTTTRQIPSLQSHETPVNITTEIPSCM